MNESVLAIELPVFCIIYEQEDKTKVILAQNFDDLVKQYVELKAKKKLPGRLNETRAGNITRLDLEPVNEEKIWRKAYELLKSETKVG